MKGKRQANLLDYAKTAHLHPIDYDYALEFCLRYAQSFIVIAL